MSDGGYPDDADEHLNEVDEETDQPCAALHAGVCAP